MNRELADFTRDEICNSAFELIRAKGYSNFTIKDFAQQAGVSVGTVYNYFESKEFFLSCLRKKVSIHLLHQIKDCVNENLAPMATLNKVVEVFLSFHHEYAFLYDTFGLDKPRATLDKEAMNHFAQMTDLIDTILLEGMRQNHFKNVDSQPVARLLILACIGAVIVNSLPESRSCCEYPLEGVCSLIKNK